MKWLLVLLALGQTSRPAESKAALKLISKEPNSQRRAILAATNLAERNIAPKYAEILRPLGLTAPGCSEFVAIGFEEGAEDAVKKRCAGKSVAELKAGTPAEMMKTCKLAAPDKKTRFDSWSLLLSALVVDELNAEKGATADEKALAKYLAWGCHAEG